MQNGKAVLIIGRKPGEAVMRNKKGFVFLLVPVVIAALWGMVVGGAVVFNAAQTPKGAALIQKSKGVNIGPDYAKSPIPAWQRQ